MSDHSSRSQLVPGPLCTAFEPLLPLVSLDELTEAEVDGVRAHLQTCDWCQFRMREYGTLLEAMRSGLGADRSAASFTVQPESIMGIRNGKSLPDWSVRVSDPANGDETAATRRQVHPRSRHLTSIGAIAAVLLLSMLAGALFAGHGLFTHAGKPAATSGAAAAEQQGVSAFPLPNTSSASDSPPAFDFSLVAVGSDGSLWSVQNGGSLHGDVRMGRVSPSGVTTVYTFPTSMVQPHAIAIGSDGVVWVADEGNDALWRIDPHTGAMRRFDLPEDAGGSPQARGGNLIGLAVEPDGKVWYLTDQGQELGRLDPATGATTTLIPWNHQKSGGLISELATASTSNGALWMRLGPALVGDHGVIGRYDIATGTMQKTDITSAVDTRLEASHVPSSTIAPASDGSAWLVAHGSAPAPQGDLDNEIVHVLPDGTFTVYPLLKRGLFGLGDGFAVDAQSNFWYLQANDDSAGSISVIRVTSQGTFQTIETLPGSQIEPTGTQIHTIVPAPDNGVVWLMRSASGNDPYFKQLEAIRIALPR